MVDNLEKRRLEWGFFTANEIDFANQVTNRLAEKHPEIDSRDADILAITTVRTNTYGERIMDLYQGVIADTVQFINRLFD